jgi:hypothetical protein
MNDHRLVDGLDDRIIAFFFQMTTFEASSEMKKTYPNKFNLYFSHRRKHRKPPIISNDPKIIQKIRGSLSKLSTSNIDSTYQYLQTIFRAVLVREEWQEIANLFYLNMLDNIFIIDSYLDLLIKLEDNFSDLVEKIHHRIASEVRKPTQYNDNLIEQGAHKTKRCQVANGMLVAHIFNKKKYSRKFLMQCIEYWITQINPDNLMGLEILVKTLPLLKFDLENGLANMLSKISQDKSYPARLRLLLTLPAKRVS